MRHFAVVSYSLDPDESQALAGFCCGRCIMNDIMQNERSRETRIVKLSAYFSSYISLTVLLSLMSITTAFEKPM